MGTKKNHQKKAKTVFFKKKKTQPGSIKVLVVSIKSVLEDFLIYHLRLIEIFSFLKKFQKITSVNFVGRDPKLLEIGAK